MAKGWKLESVRHSLARKGVKTGRKKKIWVGDLGDAVFGKSPDAVTAFYVKEEDGTKSWQLLPDYNSDTLIKSKKVIPLDPEILSDIRKSRRLK
jgi:hypothetical protein